MNAIFNDNKVKANPYFLYDNTLSAPLALQHKVYIPIVKFKHFYQHLKRGNSLNMVNLDKSNDEISDREAAAQLGAVYLRLQKIGKGTLDNWAIPRDDGSVNYQLQLGLDLVYKSAGWSAQQSYFKAYSKIKSRLEAKAFEWANKYLEINRVELKDLEKKIEGKSDEKIPGQLNKLAKEVRQKVGSWGPSYEQFEKAGAYNTAAAVGWKGVGIGQSIEAVEKANELKRQQIAIEVINQNDPTLLKLFLHPNGVSILEAYDRSTSDGTRYTLKLLREASMYTDKFQNELKGNKEHVWRYPIVIAGGIRELGLDDIEGFPQYALQLSQILGRDIVETAIGYIGMVLLCIPLAGGVGGIGAIVLGVVDLGLGGTSTVVSFMREHEKALAAKASGFMPNEQRLSNSSDYSETLLNGAFAIVSAIFVVHSLRSLSTSKKIVSLADVEAESRQIKQQVEELKRINSKINNKLSKIVKIAVAEAEESLGIAIKADPKLAPLLDLPGVRGKVSKLTGNEKIKSLVGKTLANEDILNGLRQALKTIEDQAGNLAPKVLKTQGVEEFIKDVVTKGHNTQTFHGIEYELEVFLKKLKQYPDGQFRFQEIFADLKKGPDLVHFEKGGATIIQCKSFSRADQVKKPIQKQLEKDLERLVKQNFEVIGPNGRDRVKINNLIEYHINFQQVTSGEYAAEDALDVLQRYINDYFKLLSKQDPDFLINGKPFQIKIYFE